MTAIELSKTQRADAVSSLKRYFEENFSEQLGDLPAGVLLNFILEEIGPAIYNQTVVQVQELLQLRITDLSGELYSEEFQYWPKHDAKRKSRR